LIELLIVVAIILIIAAIAVPALISSKMSANEASAIQSLRTINTAEASYSIQFGSGFSTTLAQLGGTGSVASPTNALLIDNVLATGTKSGYNFTYVVTATDPVGNPSAYSVNGNPLQVGQTGRRYFFTDESFTIRQNPTTPATATDPSI